MVIKRLLMFCTLAVLIWSGCSGDDDDVTATPGDDGTPANNDDSSPEPATSANATLASASGYTVEGTVTFTAVDGGVAIVASLSGASPGMQGLHIHETGDCSAADFSSAGGHFNPAGASHACPPEENRHAGDLGNIEIAEDGTGTLELHSDLITLEAGTTNYIGGLAVILHAGEDDCVTQTSGDSGHRIACAIITMD